MLIWVILCLLVLLICLVAVLVYKTRSVDFGSKFDAALKEKFLNFQSNIHRELNETRQEVSRSKDIISEHALKTVENIKEMGATLERIIQQQEEAQKLGHSLKDVLQAPKLRGSYGETVLEEMLERALPRSIWEKQYQIAEGKKVDAIIRFKDVIIPIDAKFPRQDYQRYIESDSPQEKEKHWKAHETAVKEQIKSISGKYINPENGTSDFALMFIPSEAIYYETIAQKNYLGETSAIFEFAQSNKVFPVSPNTFYAFLQVILIGIRNLEIIKSAKKLQEGLASIQKSFGLFYDRYEEIGKHIGKAQEAFNKGDTHISRYRKNLQDTLQLEDFHAQDLIQ
jgi:DNA recombination protein RmuC